MKNNYDRNKIINELIKSKFIERYCGKLCSDYNFLQDMIQDIWLIICSIPDSRLIVLYKNDELKAFISGIIFRQLKSKNSTIYYKYLKEKKVTSSLGNTELTDLIDKKQVIDL